MIHFNNYKWKYHPYKMHTLHILNYRVTKIILVNDRYNIPLTIKDGEHGRRAGKYSHGCNINIFPKK